MHMHDLRFPCQITREMGYSFGKKNESLRIVWIINSLFPVQFWAVIKQRLVNEVNGQAFAWLQGPDFGLSAIGTEGQIKGPIEFFDLGKTFKNPAIKRSDY